MTTAVALTAKELKTLTPLAERFAELKDLLEPLEAELDALTEQLKELTAGKREVEVPLADGRSLKLQHITVKQAILSVSKLIAALGEDSYDYLSVNTPKVRKALGEAGVETYLEKVSTTTQFKKTINKNS